MEYPKLFIRSVHLRHKHIPHPIYCLPTHTQNARESIGTEERINLKNLMNLHILNPPEQHEVLCGKPHICLNTCMHVFFDVWVYIWMCASLAP